MGDKGNKDKGKRQQEKAQRALKEKRKQKREKKGESYKGGAMAMFTSRAARQSGETPPQGWPRCLAPAISTSEFARASFLLDGPSKDRRETADEVRKAIQADG